MKINFVPYNTTGPYIDLIAGQVDIIFDALPAAIGNVKAGKLKILAITGSSRHPSFPDVPTFAEAGVSTTRRRRGLGIRACGNAEADPRQALGRHGEGDNAESVLIEKWRSYGGELKAMKPEQFAEFIRQDSEMWAKAIRSTGIQLD